MSSAWLFLFNGLDNIFALAALLLAVYLLTCLLKPVNLIESLLFGFCVASALLAVWGYILSPLGKLADLAAWTMLEALTVCAAAVLHARLKPGWVSPHRQIHSTGEIFRAWFSTSTTYEKTILLPLLVVAGGLTLFNLTLSFFTVPTSWDSMTYHLPRMAYYIQQGSFALFDADYWAQAVHPTYSTALLIYLFLAAGRNENLILLFQVAAHVTFVASIYGIAIKTGATRAQGMFAALLGALLTAGLMQISSAQNDLPIAVYCGAAVYGVFAFRKNPRGAYLLISGLGLASAVAAKLSTLAALPALALLVLYALTARVTWKAAFKNLFRFSVALLVCGCVLVLPAGYIENIQRFGNPIGPLDVKQMHSFAGQSTGYILQAGMYNALRFGFDFLSLDGLPQTDPTVAAAQGALRFIPRQVVAFFGIDLESDFAEGFAPFDFEVDRANSWGVLGFGLMWIAVLVTALRAQPERDTRMLAYTAIIFFVAQAFSGPYDTARGRYFLICALFAAPVAGLWLNARAKILRTYLVMLLLFGCASAIAVAVSQLPLFARERGEQFFFRYPKGYEQFKAYDFLVPPDAVVAVYLYPNMFEYPLFGKHLSRTVLPINSFYRGLQPIPPQAEYLLYVKGYPCADENDRHLKGDWFLRKLDEGNRVCNSP